MQEEEQNQAARKEAAQLSMNMPFRYRRNPGEEGQVVIVDEAPDWFRYEHNLMDPRTNKWDVYCACVNDHMNCPVCRVAQRPSYFALFLTVIDLSPYEDKHGNVIEWSKKLFVVKTNQQKKFARYYQQHGTLRGMILNCRRDGEKDAAIGNDIEFQGFMDEEELLTYETVVEYEDRNHNQKTREIIGHEPFDYDALFPMPTEQQLRAIAGGRPSPGSAEDEAQQLGRSTVRRGSRQDEFDEPAETTPQRRPAARPAARAPAPAARPAVRPAARPAARETIAPEDDPSAGADDVVEDEVYEEPPQRARPVARPAARPAPQAAARPAVRPAVRRPAPDPEQDEVYDEPEAQEEAAPPRAASLAQRRQALRRGG